MNLPRCACGFKDDRPVAPWVHEPQEGDLWVCPRCLVLSVLRGGQWLPALDEEIDAKVPTAVQEKIALMRQRRN